jgi:hypothetical protein
MAMGKFCDSPFFLLDDYFDATHETVARVSPVIDDSSLLWQDVRWENHPDGGALWIDANNHVWIRYIVYVPGVNAIDSYLQGGLQGIWGAGSEGGGYWTRLWININGELTEVKMRSDETDYRNGNFFNFTKWVSGAAFDPGSDAYFRNNSYFHSYVTGLGEDYENYINLKKPFMYFGKIYPRGSNPLDYHVEFHGLKDYVMNALPYQQRTDKLTEFMKVYFDRIHHEYYNLLKNSITLLDAYEVDSDYLGYISSMFGVNLVEGMTEAQKREFVKNIIHFLKRKGTYSALYIIWKLLALLTTNRLNVYERWHDGATPGPPSITSFEDKLYISYYDEDDYSCAGQFYYESLGTSAYPADYDGYGDSWTLSPHYKVEIDLSCEPLGDTYIIDEDTVDGLMEYWELVRPVSRVSSYYELLSPTTDFSGIEVSLYSSSETAVCNTKCVTPIFEPATGSAIHIQLLAGSTWTFHHELGAKNLQVQCFTLSGEWILPDSIKAQGDDFVIIEFATPRTGYAYAIIAEDTTTQVAPSADWNVFHTIGQRDILTQFDDSYRYKFLPQNVQLDSDAKYSVLFSDPTSGYGYGVGSSYTHTQAVTATTWTVNHFLNVNGIMVQCVDENWNKIFPEAMTVINANQCTLTFSEGEQGRAFIQGIGTAASQDTIMSGIISGGYFKVGVGDAAVTKIWNPVVENDVNTELFTIPREDIQIRETSSYWYVTGTGEYPNVTGDITEIGLFDIDDNLIFYTYCDIMHKPPNMGVTIHMRIAR